jgi:protein SCO1
VQPRPSTRAAGLGPIALWAAGLAVGALWTASACREGEPVEGAGSSGPRTDALPEDTADFGALPDFELTAHTGETVSLASLRGRPLVLGALFTTCTGPCPSIAGGLARLQQELAGTDALIVVVSVDPDFDTPEVLAHYARRMGAEPGRWLFLTGPEAEVHAFVRQGLFLGVDRAPEEAEGDAVTHDVRLLAVDRAGHRRGWYTGTDAVQLEMLRRRILHLAAEEPLPR